MIRPPFLISEPFAEYNAARSQFVTSSMVWEYSQSPVMCLIAKDGTAAMDFGTAAHKFILEGEAAFLESYVVGGPVNPKTGKPFGRDSIAFKDWAAGSPDKGVVTEDELKVIRSMDASVRGHALIRPYLQDGIAEGVVRAKYHGAPCQIRIDWLSADGTICDLKTCEDLADFHWNIRKYGYAPKASFYQQVYKEAARDLIEPPYRLIVVEKNAPYRCGMWMFPDEALQVIHLAARSDIAGILKSRATNVWPTGYEEIQIAEIS